ncbi:MAG: replication initiation factor family protein [Circular genetic element sp.]|nr:MAG: replication initiation factor family protein [Circular genetic element sp.]
MTYSTSDPFCDWLDVTCHPEVSFLTEVTQFLAYHFYPVAFVKDSGMGKTTGYRVGSGILVLEVSKNFHRASASGSCVGEFVKLGVFRDYVNILGSVGHNVTRLDVAVDILRDAPEMLRGLEAKYPDDLFAFGRKSLRITRLYSARATDRALTGTWYIGHRSSARVTARVYDKQAEALEKRGEILPPTTRIELTFRKDYNCSLYDVLMPESLFYSHASPKLLEVPDKYIAPWCPRGLVPWVSTPKDHTLTLDRFDARVSHSPELLKIAELGAQFGDAGKAAVMRHFERLLTSALSEASPVTSEVD